MFESNIKIISELKSFLQDIATNRDLLNYFCYSDRDFIRTRKLPFERLALLITKLCKKTLSIELETFFQELGTSISCSVSAFTQQRVKLNPLFFHCWNMILSRSFYLHYGDNVKGWKGYRIIAADGSTIILVNTPCLAGYFGGQSNQQTDFVLAKTFYHYDVLNELIIIPQIRPYRYSELNMAYDAIDKIEEDMLTIYDRNFSNCKMIALHFLQEKERKFIIRARETTLNIVKDFIASGQSNSIVDMKPTPETIKGLKKSKYIITKTTTFKVRLIRVELPDSIQVLITNLWEEENHSVSEFKDLYFMRWGIETNISIQKNILQLEAFSGLTVHAVLQDFYATVLMTNLHAVLIKDAQQTVSQKVTYRKYPMKINKNKAFGKIKVNLVSLFIKNNPQDILKILYHYFIKETVPIRKGRSYPRVRKNIKAKSKYRTYTNFKSAH